MVLPYLPTASRGWVTCGSPGKRSSTGGRLPAFTRPANIGASLYLAASTVGTDVGVASTGTMAAAVAIDWGGGVAVGGAGVGVAQLVTSTILPIFSSSGNPAS